MNVYVWAAGFKSRAAAEQAWITAQEEGEASPCEFHQIKSYRYRPEDPRRWLIELKH